MAEYLLKCDDIMAEYVDYWMTKKYSTVQEQLQDAVSCLHHWVYALYDIRDSVKARKNIRLACARGKRLQDVVDGITSIPEGTRNYDDDVNKIKRNVDAFLKEFKEYIAVHPL